MCKHDPEAKRCIMWVRLFMNENCVRADSLIKNNSKQRVGDQVPMVLQYVIGNGRHPESEH